MIGCVLYLAGYEEEAKKQNDAMFDNDYLIHHIFKTKKIDNIDKWNEVKHLSFHKDFWDTQGGIVCFGDDTESLVEQISKYVSTVYQEYVSESFSKGFQDIAKVDNKRWYVGLNLDGHPIYKKAFPAVLCGEFFEFEADGLDENLVKNVLLERFEQKKTEYMHKPGVFCDDAVSRSLIENGLNYILEDKNEVLWSFYGCEASFYSQTDPKQNVARAKENYLVPVKKLIEYYKNYETGSWWEEFYNNLESKLEKGIQVYEKQKCK